MLRRAFLAFWLLAVFTALGWAQNTPVFPGAAATTTNLPVATNNATTTVATNPVGSGDTSITVAATSSFTTPTVIWIDNEALRCTASGPTTFSSCTRGFDNTVAATHNVGATVSNLISAYYVNQLNAEVIRIETDLLGLSGDATLSASGSNLISLVAKVNGVAYPSGPSTNTVPVVTGSNQVTYEAVPNAALANSGVTISSTSPLAGGGAVSLGGSLTLTCSTCVTGSSLTSGQILKGNAGQAIAVGDLSGDVSTFGSLVTTVAKVNGVSYGSNPSSNTVPVVTGANTVTYEAVPNAALANSAVTVTAGAGLGGGGSVSLGSSVTLKLAFKNNSQAGQTSYNVQNSDCGKVINFSASGAVAVSLPQAGSGGNFTDGCLIGFNDYGLGTVTITPSTSTIDGSASAIAIQTNSGILISSDGSNYWTVRGIGSSVNDAAINVSGTSASLPAAGTAGRTYWPTDGYELYYDNGTSWIGFGPLYPLTDVTTPSFSWDNQNTSTVTNVGHATVLTVPTGAGHNWAIRLISAPATPYTITAGFIPTSVAGGGSNPVEFGLLMRESSTAKMETCTMTTVAGGFSGFENIVSKFTNETTFSANYQTNNVSVYGPPFWVRMTDTGTNIVCAYSSDGVNFVNAQSQSRTDFMSGGPNQVGFGADNVGSGASAYMTLISWKQS